MTLKETRRATTTITVRPIEVAGREGYFWRKGGNAFEVVEWFALKEDSARSGRSRRGWTRADVDRAESWAGCEVIGAAGRAENKALAFAERLECCQREVWGKD